ncbi:MAG: PDZ domain-containing protein [Phycisphaerales bacterium]|nr:PDZ domain-containing protein [Phycisphaerales bacterium]
MERRTQRERGTILFTMALAAIAGAASAGEPPAADVSFSIDQLISSLSSPDFDRRCGAEDALRRRTDATMHLIEERLRDDSLDPEQRARLDALARAKFGDEPRAALGIQYGERRIGNRRFDSPVIGLTLEGFDADRVLQPGDAIISFDGSKVKDQQSLRCHILSYDPGEIARLQVERDDVLIDVEVLMGSQEQLRRNDDRRFQDQRFGAITQDITDSNLDDAWAVRTERMGIAREPGPVLDGELSGAAWHLAMDGFQSPADARPSDDMIQIAAGGLPRGGGTDAMRPFAGGQFEEGGRYRNASRGGRDAAVQQLRTQIDILTNRIDTLRRRLELVRPQDIKDMDVAGRARVNQDLDELHEAERTLDDQLRRLGQLRGSTFRPPQPRR